MTDPVDSAAPIYMTEKTLDGIGRSDLVAAYLSMVRYDAHLAARISYLQGKLEESNRGRLPGLGALPEAITRARRLHPEGSDLHDLLSEVAELARAMAGEGPERTREEALDVAVVALRIYLGEKPAPFEF